MKLSYGILVCNEREEIEKLINKLTEFINDDDEIIIVADSDSLTDSVADYLISLEQADKAKFYLNPLNKDFAQQKNFLISKCSGDYIINIDADEIPNDVFLVNIKNILTQNEGVDIIAIPRVNIVNGITQEYIQQMGWQQNENGWINFPDYQTRVHRNAPDIYWEGKVHETLVGGTNIAPLPTIEDLSFYHIKEFERQKKQNELYDTIQR